MAVTMCTHFERLSPSYSLQGQPFYQFSLVIAQNRAIWGGEITRSFGGEYLGGGGDRVMGLRGGE